MSAHHVTALHLFRAFSLYTLMAVFAGVSVSLVRLRGWLGCGRS